MAATPAFLATVRVVEGSLSTADTSRTAPTTTLTLISGVAGGTAVTRITVTATGTTTAGVIRLFVSNDNGTTKRLLEELIVLAVTPSTTVPVWSGTFKRATLAQPLWLVGTTNILYCTTNNSEGFTVRAEGGDL